jgi:ABC-2 type transport system permease protein
MMFARLLWKECKQMHKCTTYYIVIVCMVLFYTSQLGGLEVMKKPVQGQEDYGIRHSKEESDIMNETAKILYREYSNNSYSAYPIGFYKNIRLNDKKKMKMSEIVSEVTGITKEELEQAIEQRVGNYNLFDASNNNQTTIREITAAPGLTFEKFKDLMKKADKLLGGGSSYSETFLYSNAWVPMTYEDALEEYNDIIEYDQLTGAYARLFCDYMGVILTILPVFIAVTRVLRDRRARAREVIYAREASSFTIVLSRYLAMLLTILLPVILLGFISMLQCYYYGIRSGLDIDYFAYVNYILGWLLPGIMVSTSVGVFLTELTDTAIAILVQGIWWFISLLMGIATIDGGYGWNLIPRHNELGNYTAYHDNFGILAVNRITYAAAAILLILLTVIVYEAKRKGKLDIRGKIFSNRKNKSEI